LRRALCPALTCPSNVSLGIGVRYALSTNYTILYLLFSPYEIGTTLVKNPKLEGEYNINSEAGDLQSAGNGMLDVTLWCGR